jgi:hypothetical protein
MGIPFHFYHFLSCLFSFPSEFHLSIGLFGFCVEPEDTSWILGICVEEQVLACGLRVLRVWMEDRVLIYWESLQ